MRMGRRFNFSHGNGVDDARFRFLSARLAISQKQLPMSRGGFGQGVENFHVQNRLGAGAKGDGLLPVSEVQGHGVGQRRGHFLERAQERPLERRAAVLLQRLFRHEQREQFAFGDLQGWKIADFFGVTEAVARAIEFNEAGRHCQGDRVAEMSTSTPHADA